MFSLNCGSSWEYIFVWGTAEVEVYSCPGPVSTAVESEFASHIIWDPSPPFSVSVL